MRFSNCLPAVVVILWLAIGWNDVIRAQEYSLGYANYDSQPIYADPGYFPSTGSFEIQPGYIYPSSPQVVSQPTISYVPVGLSHLSNRLRQVLIDAKNNIDAGRRPRLDEAQAKLAQALESLERYVGVGTTNGEKWSKFLRLPKLRELLADETPSRADLHDLEMSMRQNYLGLEYPQFIRLREALTGLANAVRFTVPEDRFRAVFNKNLDQTLEEIGKQSSDDDTLELQLGEVLADLTQANQPSAAQQLRGIFSSPNVNVIVDGRLVNRLVSRPVSQPSPVSDNILGTQIVGDAYLGGNVSAQLIPMSQGIGLQLNLNATMNSQTLGFNRGVVITASSWSPVLASKQIFVTDGRVSTSGYSVQTSLQSSIENIDHRRRIVRRIAGRRAAKMKPQADFIAETKLQDRLGTQFSQQVDEQVAQAQGQLDKLRQQPRPELGRLGIELPQLAMYSTSSDIHASATHSARHQLAAPGPCMLPRPASALVVGQLHQSAINNALETILAGRVIRNKDLGGYAHQIAGKVPDKLREETKEDPWSITLGTFRPIRIDLDDGLINLTVRIDRSERGKDRIREPFNVSVSYLPQFSGSRLMLTRQGDVEVTSKETGIRATALRAFLKKKFDSSFQKSIVTEPLDLSKYPQVQNLRLNLDQLAVHIDDGWLQVAIP